MKPSDKTAAARSADEIAFRAWQAAIGTPQEKEAHQSMRAAHDHLMDCIREEVEARLIIECISDEDFAVAYEKDGDSIFDLAPADLRKIFPQAPSFRH